MHAPDGFLNAGTAVASGAVSAGTIGLALGQAKHLLRDRQIPLAGLAAAFIFAAQMFNFPVVGGTTGHLLGGALAAILLGPHIGAVVVTIVVVVQALVFADGGLTALGYNTLNMAIIPAYGGFALFRMFRTMMPVNTGGIVAATGLAAWASVVLSAMGFSIEWLFGATAPVSFTNVFTAMVGIHVLIGIGEGVISAMAIGTVLASRPDLVFGVADLGGKGVARTKTVPLRAFLLAGVLAALFFGVVVSQFAFDAPDGLESVAEQTGIAESASDHALGGSIFADYATYGLENEAVSLAVAGGAGTLIALAVGWGVFYAARKSDPSRRVVA